MSEQQRLEQYLANSGATYGHVKVEPINSLREDIINIKRGVQHFQNIDNL